MKRPLIWLFSLAAILLILLSLQRILMDFNRLSNYFGAIAAAQLPTPLQRALNGWYVRHFEIDLAGFAPADSYPSLNALFTRSLLHSRPLDEGFVSPCDGLLLYSGKGDGDEAYSIKNSAYSVAELLGQSLKSGELAGGFSFFNIYLSPKDYHHYHAPADMEILSTEYVPGELYSVAPKWLARVAKIYTKNERVILKGRLKNGELFWMVFVGALNVGKMRFDHEPNIKTNAHLGHALYDHSAAPISLKKGDHIGHFELGSTIVIIAPKNAISYTTPLNTPLKQGRKIGDI